jgi:hypothetical protein
MGVKTVVCEACRRDMPKGMTSPVVIEGYELIVCTDPVDCRIHQEEVNNAEEAAKGPAGGSLGV